MKNARAHFSNVKKYRQRKSDKPKAIGLAGHESDEVKFMVRRFYKPRELMKPHSHPQNFSKAKEKNCNYGYIYFKKRKKLSQFLKMC